MLVTSDTGRAIILEGEKSPFPSDLPVQRAQVRIRHRKNQTQTPYAGVGQGGLEG